MKEQFLKKLKKGAVSMADMANYLNTSERYVRMVAQKIKNENLQNAKQGWLLISGNYGYKVSKNVDEINEYIKRMHSMAMAILKETKEASKFIKHEESKKGAIKF